MKVSFIGLGVMGYHMAGNCQKQGYSVTAYNRTVARAQAWEAEFAGEYRDTIADAVEDADIILFCVGNDDDVREICYGESGIIESAKSGAILIDHTTASAELAQELYAACQAKGLEFLDAPVSGGEAGAINGQLAVMVGGDAEPFAQAEPVMKTYSKLISHIGESGSGQKTKMVNQICIAGLLQALSEAMNFSERAGLDTEKVLGVISKGAAQSWQMENRGHTMIQDAFDFGFAVEWMRKDLGLCLQEAERICVSLPVTALVNQYYQQVMQRGGARWDTSSLYKLLADQPKS